MKKKNNNLKKAYNRCLRAIKNLNDDELSIVIDSVTRGWIAWKQLETNLEAPWQEVPKDAIDKIDEDLTKKGKKNEKGKRV